MQDDGTLRHTPGPWKISRSDRVSKYPPIFMFLIEPDRDGDDAVGTFVAEGDADARLIAAAPELLEACRVALAGYRGLTGDDDGPEYFERTLGDVMNALSAAIAKAEGRS